MKTLFKTFPIACFVALTFAIAYAIGLPLKLFVLNHAFQDSEIGLNYLSKILIVFAPGIAALIVTANDGEEGTLPNLLRKLKPDTEHIIWWLAFIFGGIAITMAAYVIGGFSVSKLLDLITASNPILLVLHLLGALFIIGIGEELGWRGWLLPKLLQTQNPARATLVVFVVWAAWHLPVLFSGTVPVISFLITCLSLSVIFTRFWDHVNHNIFVLALAHASVDFPTAFFEGRVNADPLYNLNNAHMALSLIYLLVAAVVYFYDRLWWRLPYKPSVDEIAIPMEDRPGLD